MAPIYVKHYPTKVVIENPGGFPGDINESNIITHQSIPRNKLIAMTLQHLKYVQRSGQGVDIMFQSMLTEGKPYPEYAKHAQLCPADPSQHDGKPEFHAFLRPNPPACRGHTPSDR